MSNSYYSSHTLIDKDENKKMTSIINSLYENQESIEFRLPVDYKGLGLTDYLTVIKTPMDLSTVKKSLKSGRYRYVEDMLNDIQLIWDNCKTYNAEGSWIWRQADKLEKYTKKLIKTYLPLIKVKGAKKEQGENHNHHHHNHHHRQHHHHNHHNGDNTNNNNNDENENENDGLDENNSINESESSNSNSNNNSNSNSNNNDDGDENNETITYQEKIKLTQKVKQISQEHLGNIIKIIQEECSSAWKEIEKDRFQILVDNLNKQTFRKIHDYILSLEQNITEPTGKKLKHDTSSRKHHQ